MCSIGGATRGFLDAGIKVVKGYDHDPQCKDIYERNNYPAKFIEKDITELNGQEVLDGLDLREDDYLTFIICAPCQPFSAAGAQDPNDTRIKVILSMNDLIEEIVPDFIFVENVPGFKLFYPKIFEQFLEPYKKLNYFYDYSIQNVKIYGIPQNRRRFSFLASKKFDIKIPKPMYGPNLTPYVTVKKVISRYPPLSPGERHPTIPNHMCSNLHRKTLQRIQNTPKDGGSRSDWPENLILDCHKNFNGYHDVYGRMKWDEPSPTITCRCNSVSNGRFVHPVQNRGLSIREAAALQTFNDDFIFTNLLTIAAKHIGNAVPPKLAKLYAHEILNTVSLKEYSKFTKMIF